MNVPIIGSVGPHYEPMFRIKLCGPTGIMHELDVLIDTGFSSELALPPSIISFLGLTNPVLTRITLG